MRRMFVLAVTCVLLMGACGDDGDTEAEPDAPVTDEGTDTGGSSEEGDPDDGGSSEEDVPEEGGTEGGSAMGTATIDGVVYEFPDVRDCGVGDPAFPNDRDFVGYSADGEVVMTASYFEDESLAGLNSISVEVDEPHALYSSQYAPDGEFVIDVLPNGAKGTTTVGAVGIEVSSGDREATWSFTC